MAFYPRQRVTISPKIPLHLKHHTCTTQRSIIVNNLGSLPRLCIKSKGRYNSYSFLQYLSIHLNVSDPESVPIPPPRFDSMVVGLFSSIGQPSIFWVLTRHMVPWHLLNVVIGTWVPLLISSSHCVMIYLFIVRVTFIIRYHSLSLLISNR